MRRLILALADGLRPDAITPTRMPSLSALAATYTSAAARSVRPSATVAALASLATGVARDTHRLIQPGSTSCRASAACAGWRGSCRAAAFLRTS